MTNLTGRILLTGASGQVGGELQRRLSTMGSATEVLAPPRAELDLSQPRSIRDVVRSSRPALIINAAAWTAVAPAENQPAAARAANTDAPAVLAEEARRLDIPLIHFSTDYVFDGHKSTPYTEDDETHPLNVYGATKRDGELAIAASGAAHWIFRTSWVYNVHGGNFMKTVIRLAQQNDELSIVADQVGAPTRAASIADICCRLLQDGGTQRIRTTSGIYHLSAAGAASWHEYATLIVGELLRLGVPLALSGVERIRPVPSSAYPPPPARPLNSRLCCDKLIRTFGVTLPDWKQDAHDCVGAIVRHAGLLPGGKPDD